MTEAKGNCIPLELLQKIKIDLFGNAVVLLDKCLKKKYNINRLYQ